MNVTISFTRKRVCHTNRISPEVDVFLERRGVESAAFDEKLAMFQVAWESFKKRDVLSLPLPSAETMQQQQGGEKTDGKRKRDVLTDKAGTAVREPSNSDAGKRAMTGDGSLEAPLVV